MDHLRDDNPVEIQAGPSQELLQRPALCFSAGPPSISHPAPLLPMYCELRCLAWRLCITITVLNSPFRCVSALADDIRSDRATLLASIDPDQELSRDDFDTLFGHIPNTPLVKIVKGIPIYCGIELQDIRDIDAARGTYAMRGFLWYYWDDPRFRFDAENIDSLKWDFAAISGLLWIPEIEFDNSSEAVRRWGETIEVFPKGEVEYWCYFSGTFSDQDGLMDFRRFPCEVLPVSLDLTSPYRKSLLTLRFCRESEPSDAIKELRLRRHPEFAFSGGRVVETSRTYTSEWDREFSVLRFTVDAKRHKGYYLIHIVLPVIAILAVFLVGQRVCISEFEARIGLALTCLLSLIAYTFSFSDSLPKLGYLTLMDYFITANYLLIALGTISTCTHRWAGSTKDSVMRFSSAVDAALPWSALTLVILVLCVFVLL
jgi:hypothetical protein